MSVERKAVAEPVRHDQLARSVQLLGSMGEILVNSEGCKLRRLFRPPTEGQREISDAPVVAPIVLVRHHPLAKAVKVNPIKPLICQNRLQCLVHRFRLCFCVPRPASPVPLNIWVSVDEEIVKSLPTSPMHWVGFLNAHGKAPLLILDATRLDNFGKVGMLLPLVRVSKKLLNGQIRRRIGRQVKPSRPRLFVAEVVDVVLAVEIGILCAFVISEAEVLKINDFCDVGERHPDAEAFDADTETFRKQSVELVGSRPHAPPRFVKGVNRKLENRRVRFSFTCPVSLVPCPTLR